MTTIAEQLQKSELFRDVSMDDIAALVEVLHPKHYEAGTIIFNLGDEGDTMYIILKGRVRIYTVDEQKHELTLMFYQDSQIFGEFALLDNKPRSASAAAAVATDLLALQRNDFMEFLLKRPQVSLAMMRSLSQRARYTTRYVEEVVNWTKRLANGQYQQAIEEISSTQADDQANPNQIQGLIAAFMQMIKNVQEREQKLQQELVRLQVQIDQGKRDTQVQRITRTQFFANLKAQAQEMRAQTGSIPANIFDDIEPPDATLPDEADEVPSSTDDKPSP